MVGGIVGLAVVVLACGVWISQRKAKTQAEQLLIAKEAEMSRHKTPLQSFQQRTGTGGQYVAMATPAPPYLRDGHRWFGKVDVSMG